MKRLLSFLSAILIVGTLFAAVPRSAKASTQDFTIQSFDADFYLSRNEAKTSLLSVDETIVAVFPNYDQNHGILRSIPETYQSHTVSLDALTVTDENKAPIPFSVSHQNDNTVLKIGNANTYVRGIHTYKIHYTLRNVISFQDSDEFYWDVNGTEWQQPFSSVTARIHVPSDLSPQLTNQQMCFSGAQSSKEGNCSVSSVNVAGDTTITATTGAALRPSETLTFDIGFTKGTFVRGPEIVAAQRARNIRYAVYAGLATLPIITTIVVIFSRWRGTGKDPKGRGVIIPEYQPPKGHNVLSSAYILNESLPSKAISASIIELAVQGYLKISEIDKGGLIRKKKDYQLTIVKDLAGLSPEQRSIVVALFPGAAVGDIIDISKQKNKLYTTLTTVSSQLATSLTAKKLFMSNPEKVRSKFTTKGVILLAIGIGTQFIHFAPLSFLGAGLIFSGILVMSFSKIMPARSLEGVELHDYLLGLKDYIDLAEADRIRFLQSPEGAEKIASSGVDPGNPAMQVKLFEKLLPYAMLFGLEKKWAEQFKDLYTSPPDWYSGNMNTFNAVYLANSLNGFGAANSAAFTAPSSSSSSGFGGGGFSGGGGGGGGGGGW